MGFGAIGALLSVVLVRRFAPKQAGIGIPHLEAVLHRLRSLNWIRVLPVKFIAGTLALGGGLALGQEGPTVQMGAQLACNFQVAQGAASRTKVINSGWCGCRIGS